MVNFGPIDEVPKQFAGRNLYKHNPLVTLMRTSVEENKVIAEKLAERWNETENKMTLFLPKQGVSMIDAKGQPFDGPEERKVLFDTLKIISLMKMLKSSRWITILMMRHLPRQPHKN